MQNCWKFVFFLPGALYVFHSRLLLSLFTRPLSLHHKLRWCPYQSITRVRFVEKNIQQIVNIWRVKSNTISCSSISKIKTNNQKQLSSREKCGQNEFKSIFPHFTSFSCSSMPYLCYSLYNKIGQFIAVVRPEKIAFLPGNFALFCR